MFANTPPQSEAVGCFFPDLREYGPPMKEYLRWHGHERNFYHSLDLHEAEVYQALDESGLLDERRAAQETTRRWKVVRTNTPAPVDLTQLASLAKLVR